MQCSKTYTVKVIVNEIRDANNSILGLKCEVCVTTTGIAAYLFDITPTDLSEDRDMCEFKFSVGIGTTKSNFLESIDVFIIDEVSMLTLRVVRDIYETNNVINN